MHFSLDVLPARKGDCLMLHYGSQTEPHLMLIDGGPSGVYGHLKARLQEVLQARRRGGLDSAAPLPVDVVLVSHIDDDHIRGLIELTSGQLSNNPDLRIKVGSLWHNTFDDILSHPPEDVLSTGRPISVTASVNRSPVFDEVESEGKEAHQTLEVLASIGQGRQLRDDREALQKRSPAQRDWQLNRQFHAQLILAEPAAKPTLLSGGLTVTVVGPAKPDLEALREEHDKWLRDRKDGKRGSLESVLAAFVDKSVPNLSSIVLFAAVEDKSMLLTGDARGDKILQGLEQAGILPKDGKRCIDILKVPHHGSDNNMEEVFFRRLPAKHYVFSGNGEHGNPERATLEMLQRARDEQDEFFIHFTYPIKVIDTARKDHWNVERAKERKRLEKRREKHPDAGKTLRKAWSAQSQSLSAFFKTYPVMARRCRFVTDQPHMIDLLDPVSFSERTR